MCGRYTLAKTKKTIVEHYSLAQDLDSLMPRYNIAPAQSNPVVIQSEGHKEMSFMEWGLPWLESPSSRRIINGRAETILQKNSFKNSFQHRRCLIPADGFIEWQNIQGAKYPHHITLKSGNLFSFAGICSESECEEKLIQSYCIITTEANPLLQPIHHRMPVILNSSHYDSWLSNEANPMSLLPLLKPYPEEQMSHRTVSMKVNSAKNDNIECLQSADLPPIQETLF